MRNLKSIHAIWLCAVLLVGCGSLGIPKAETFAQKLAGGYVTVSGIREGTLLLGQAGRITKDDAQNVQDQADNLRAGLDVADTLRSTQPAAAGQKLSATLAALRALDAYVTSRGTP